MSDNIFWIGEDIDKENKNKTLLRQSFSFEDVLDLNIAFNQLKALKFEFVFVIINFKLFENFTKIYNEEFAKQNRVIIASIIICDNIYDNFEKKYVNHPFYNPGGITDDIRGVVNYINYVQNSYYKSPSQEKFIDLDRLHQEGFGKMIFQIISEEKDLIIPIMWNKIINDFKIDGYNLSKFQRTLIYNYSELKQYIYPAREKIFKVSDHILAKFFLYLYTKESGFYSSINRILSYDDGFDIYREFITVLFLSLRNKTFETYTKQKLYRGTIIAKTDLERLNELMNKKKEKDEILFFSKNFLSFSKSRGIADFFKNRGKGKVANSDSLLLCIFILEKGENSTVYNIDILDNTAATVEEEVLFLPMSSFLITKVEIIDKYQNYIYLKYLDKYKIKIDDKFRKITQSEKDKLDFKKAFLNDYGKYIYMLYNNIIEDYNKYISRDIKDFKVDIPDITKNYSDESNQAIINYDPKDDVKNFLREEMLNNDKNEKINNKIIYNVTEKDIDQEGFVRILGENKQGDDFVKLNKDKVNLTINGKESHLCYKYKLNLGINEIIFNFTEKVDDFSYLFFDVTSLFDISAVEKWDVNNVVNLNHLFSGCGKLTDISALRKWDTSSCKNFSCLFSNCISLKDISPLSNWNVGNGIFFSYLFYNCSSLEYLYGLDNWDVSQGKFFSCAFAYCSKLKHISPLDNWNTSSGLFFSHLFFNCTSLSDITALENWNVSNGSFFDYLFYKCQSLYDLNPIKNWDIRNANTFDYAFYGCTSLIDLNPLKNWSISNNCSVISMFIGCNSVEESRPSWYYRTL